MSSLLCSEGIKKLLILLFYLAIIFHVLFFLCMQFMQCRICYHCPGFCWRIFDFNWDTAMRNTNLILEVACFYLLVHVAESVFVEQERDQESVELQEGSIPFLSNSKCLFWHHLQLLVGEQAVRISKRFFYIF